ncbi:acylphosphatase [Amphibacillus marinus]|uniref:Acylphosphatase n=1 Tax=Amphibacillus marinus TaxID=872970 RepID=A0A1H8GNY6_9BACI|nr:acylphosphatase [Amphibacillus marinus]SEN45217.1 acylphosphatase [Amphibacillus marinus]
MAKVRAHLVVTGRVQGVGFRYTTQDTANRLGIKGWVKNLANGDVQIEAEGEVKMVYQFIDLIKAGPSRPANVEHVDLSITEELSHYKKFDIHY